MLRVLSLGDTVYFGSFSESVHDDVTLGKVGCFSAWYGDTHTYSTDVISAVCGPSMVTHTPDQLMSPVLYVAQVWWHTHLINWCHRCCMWPKYGDTHTPNQLMSSVLYVAQVWWHTHLINRCQRCCMWPKYGDTHTPNQLMSSVLYVAQVWWHTHIINWCHQCCMWPKYGDTHT